MHPFETMISVLGAIVLAIIVLTGFFKLVGWFDRRTAARARDVAFEGVLDDQTRATVHLGGGSTLEQVRLIGYTDLSTAKSPVPHELRNMVVFEHPDGRRTMVQARMIRMIAAPPPAR